MAGHRPALSLDRRRALARKVWVLTYDSRPWTLNVERQGRTHWSKVSALTAEWRTYFKWVAVQQKIPPLKSLVVEAHPVVRTRRSIPDTAACVGAVKAAIDGLVDAGVVPDDGPEYVTRISFHAPEVGEKDALTLSILGEPIEESA